MAEYLFTAIWPVHEPRFDVHALALLAEPDMLEMVEEEGAVLAGDPQWTLHGDRLTVVCPARRRAPWDENDREDAAQAYLIGLLPDAA